MNIQIEQYINAMLETTSEKTVKGHKSTLKNFAAFVDAEEAVEVIVKDVVRYRNHLFATKTSGTTNTMLKRVKKFFSWCVDTGLIDDSPASEVKLIVESEPLPKWLTEEQEDLLIRAVRKKYLGSAVAKKSYRELAIIFVMLKAGLRVGEVVNLKWEHIVNGKMLIHGKANQQRTVSIIKDLAKVLQDYKEHHGVKGEYVFYSQKSNQITERRIQDIVKEFQGIGTSRTVISELHPHMLRHTFAHNLANGGMQLEQLARVMGHMKKNGTPNIQQTIRYTKASDSEIADNMEKILATT